MTNILLVGIGGFAGSICRYLTGLLSQKLFSAPFLPYGTLSVNIAGCLLIGLFGGLSETKAYLTPELRALIMVGFLGGFTTFSTFGLDLFTLARSNQIIPLILNIMIHLILGISAVWLGFSISRLM